MVPDLSWDLVPVWRVNPKSKTQNLKMQKKKKNFNNHWILGLSLLMVGGVAIAQPSRANPPNQSDITGTNVFNSVAPRFFDEWGGRLDPAILDEARQRSSQLEDAYNACVQSIDEVEGGARRFSVRPGSSSDATTAACDRYNQRLSETRRFLDQVQNDTEIPRRALRGRPW
jgi:hypothetical protein